MLIPKKNRKEVYKHLFKGKKEFEEERDAIDSTVRSAAADFRRSIRPALRTVALPLFVRSPSRRSRVDLCYLPNAREKTFECVEAVIETRRR